MRWVYADIPNEQVRSIQQTVFNDEWQRFGYQLEENSHITIIPGFRFDGTINKPNLQSTEIGISGFRFYPSRSKPMVVMLDISGSSELSSIREKLVEKIGKDNIKYGLHPYHITLFKAGDSGEESQFQISEKAAGDIVSRCEESAVPSSTSIRSIQIDNW